VIAVHRHGDRSPIGWCHPDFKTDWVCDEQMYHASPSSQTIDNESKYCYPGQLTPRGKAQMQAFGKRLRKTYVDMLGFLNKKYNPEHIELRSTPIPRTEQSVENVLKGMYPDVSSILILIRLPAEEATFIVDSLCKRMEELNRMFRSQDWFKAFYESEKAKLMQKEGFNKILDTPLNDRKQRLRENEHWPVHMFDFLSCVQQNPNSKMPAWATPEIVNKIEQVATVDYFSRYYFTPEFLRLAIGRYLVEIREEMELAIQHKSRKKLTITASHDTFLVPLLQGLNVFDGRWPKIGSYVLFELFEDKKNPDKHFVRMIYNDKVLPLLPNKEFIPFEEYLKLSLPLEVHDFKMECQEKK
jgi:hypothetical protein